MTERKAKTKAKAKAKARATGTIDLLFINFCAGPSIVPAAVGVPVGMSTPIEIAQKDKHWFITGASSGFGRLLAEYLLSKGVKVVATARDVDELGDLTTRFPGSVFILQLDVSKPQNIEDAVEDARARVGHIDVLVNNAGYGVAGAVEEVNEREYRPMFETNFFGAVNLINAWLPQFRARRSGCIVNMSSIGGLIGAPGWGYYNATKFALEGLTEALSAELEPLGIHVMAVEAGPFRTEFLGRPGGEAKLRIADYEPTVAKTREYFHSQAGKQPGDPQKAVEAIVAAVSAPEPPKHLLLGKQAYDRFVKYQEERNAEIEKWRDVTLGTDFPEN